MKEVLKKDILEIISKTIQIMEVKEKRDIEELKTLSDKSVEDIAIHKDFDVISITVLVYSIYKITPDISADDHHDLLVELRSAKKNLEQSKFGNYNKNIRNLFNIIRRSNVKVKEHFEDVMHASRIKKGAVLLKKGLSLGQAAGLMGLSNWDLQEYAGRMTALEQHRENVPAARRIEIAFKIFKVK